MNHRGCPVPPFRRVRRRFRPVRTTFRSLSWPSRGQVRVRVEACGICHSDDFVKQGRCAAWNIRVFRAMRSPEPLMQWARASQCPGRVNACRRGDFVNCANLKIPGFTHDGGYAEYVINPAEGLARMPEELSPADAAPLMCAGITTFNALRNSGARGGDLVAVHGMPHDRDISAGAGGGRIRTHDYGQSALSRGLGSVTGGVRF